MQCITNIPFCVSMFKKHQLYKNHYYISYCNWSEWLPLTLVQWQNTIMSIRSDFHTWGTISIPFHLIILQFINGQTVGATYSTMELKIANWKWLTFSRNKQFFSAAILYFMKQISQKNNGPPSFNKFLLLLWGFTLVANLTWIDSCCPDTAKKPLGIASEESFGIIPKDFIEAIPKVFWPCLGSFVESSNHYALWYWSTFAYVPNQQRGDIESKNVFEVKGLFINDVTFLGSL